MTPQQRYYWKHRDQINARKRELRKAFGGKLPSDRLWIEHNRDKTRGYSRAYRQRNLEQCRKWTRDYMRRNAAKRTPEEREAHNRWKREVWYVNNRDRILAASTARAESIRQIIRAAKEIPCADCGMSYPYYVMDFDHVRGDKKFTVGRMLSGPAIERVIEEIEKCDVVCSNCHRERTHQRRMQCQPK